MTTQAVLGPALAVGAETIRVNAAMPRELVAEVRVRDATGGSTGGRLNVTRIRLR